jgi:carbon monoxide dehydrogenase subunit G
MEVKGTTELDASREIVWRVIGDPAQLAGVMPGVESFEIKDDRHWQAKVKVPLGLGGLKMTLDFERLEERPLEHSSLRANGRGMGATMVMTTSFTLSGEGEPTTMAWSADVTIGGRVGALGQRVLQPIINQQVRNLLLTLEAKVAEEKARYAVT